MRSANVPEGHGRVPKTELINKELFSAAARAIRTQTTYGTSRTCAGAGLPAVSVSPLVQYLAGGSLIGSLTEGGWCKCTRVGLSAPARVEAFRYRRGRRDIVVRRNLERRRIILKC